MEHITNTGVIYTQNVDTLPIEERVFFRAATGAGVNDGRFREATAEELKAHEEYNRLLEESWIGRG